ncbi:hypothetical protein HFO28_34610 [Rhizobium leguminosarum]|uniref:hypothetical protein n=1 Tax=Rhizobium leguminosarum TaxID=384 RepID=UPI001C96746B|nr:hypothetical protein [Rhizobium leguminosarum]MBY5748644.1 hypothetical protein [Rhizobium leguminosarum]
MDQAGRESASEPTSWWRTFRGEIQSKAVGAIVAGTLSVLAIISLALWALTTAWVKEQITTVIQQEITNRKALLTQTIDKEIALAMAEKDNDIEKVVSKKIEDALSNRTGNISAGSFFLSGSTPQQKIFVYAPTGHKLTLYMKLARLGDKERIVLVSPWESKPLDKDGRFRGDFDLSKAATLEKGVKPDEAEFNSLYEIAFKLTRDDVEPIASVASVSYVAVVSPPIQVGP